MSATYQIRDEPVGGAQRGLIVDPFWALLGLMVGGAWLGAALFAINAWFLRGPNWQRELALTVALLLGAPVIALLMVGAGDAGVIPEVGMKYAFLTVILWKLAVGYWIYFQQQTGFDLYQYFGGKPQNGLPIVVLSALFLNRYVIAAVDHPLWRTMVS
ncbi:MAG TPA: hypothetical protein VFR59_08935 [Steroidobacteraceae bacterium]|nr:hypothetical protein [Steroidobacteraceae bacterium]